MSKNKQSMISTDIDVESINKIVNDRFNILRQKANKISELAELKLKLKNSEIQINNILKKYDKLSSDLMNIEEKYMFANYLINIFENANKKFDISKYFDVDDKKLETVIKLMKSDDIHDKVIGIDNFMSLSHTLEALIINIILIINNINYKFISDYDIYQKLGEGDRYYEFDDVSEIEKEKVKYLYNYTEKISNNFIEKLNYFRNRKGLKNMKFETLDKYFN